MLSTQYLGLSLKNPLVASAAPPNADLSYLRRLEDAGAAAVVLPSLFQEQVEAETEIEEAIYNGTAHNSPEASDYFAAPVTGPYGVGPERYLELIRRAREALSIPVIASLNGSSEAGWIQFAQLMQQAGAHALELNMHVIPVDLGLTGRSVEERYVGALQVVHRVLNIPVAMKLSPYVSAVGELAVRLQQEGADGLVLFNRLLQPDIDLVNLRLTETLHLSAPDEMRVPLLWIALLAGRVKTSLGASTGVETADEVVKYLLAGADAVMTTSALLRHGPMHVATLLRGLQDWMQRRDYTTVSQLRGLMSWRQSRNKELYGRPSYMRILGRPAAS